MHKEDMIQLIEAYLKQATSEKKEKSYIRIDKSLKIFM